MKHERLNKLIEIFYVLLNKFMFDTFFISFDLFFLIIFYIFVLGTWF